MNDTPGTPPTSRVSFYAYRTRSRARARLTDLLRTENRTLNWRIERSQGWWHITRDYTADDAAAGREPFTPDPLPYLGVAPSGMVHAVPRSAYEADGWGNAACRLGLYVSVDHDGPGAGKPYPVNTPNAALSVTCLKCLDVLDRDFPGWNG